MPENIEKIEIKELFPEEKKESQEEVSNPEIIKENNELAKTELLKEIHNKEVKVGTGNKTQALNDEGKISNIVKQFYSFGVKAIEEARKKLSAYDLDRLHDQITNKNKKQ